MEHRGAWASNLGFILAAAGSAIGLGNIWKFPGKVGANGGGTFIVIYLLIVALIGFAIMLAEITIGRHTAKNAVGAYGSIHKRWGFVGKIGVVTAFIILAYYSVVGGWVMKYITTYITGADFGVNTAEYFGNHISKVVEPLLWHVAFMVLTVAIVIKGVSAGIEKVSKVLMPVLLIILVLITVRATTLPGASEGLSFIFSFNMADINTGMIIAALGQAFFSLSLGMGVMVTYGSYVSKNDSITKSVTIIATLDTLIALIAGIAIICAVFATDPSLIGQGGGGFAFISLPNIFANMPLGTVTGLLFFVLLFFAAITSAMSILEGLVAFVTEEYALSRIKATIGLGVALTIIGSFYSLSQGAIDITLPWFDFTNGVEMQSVGNVMELMTDNVLMPIGALFICIFVGYIWKPENAIKEIEQEGKFPFALSKVWSFLIKFICPIAILIILITTIGFGQSIS